MFRHNGFAESSVYRLYIFTVPVSLLRVNVEAYNFHDVKCLFRAHVFWRWRLSPLTVHPSMMLGICVEGCWGLRGCCFVSLWWRHRDLWPIRVMCCGLGFRGLRDSGNQDVGESFSGPFIMSVRFDADIQIWRLPAGRMHAEKLQVLTGR